SRFKDDRDIWSSSEVRLFYVLGSNFATDIVEAEYWLDTDPGAGGGTALTITQGANPVAIASLPFESVPIGLHSLGIRFKDDRDIWSSSEVRLFYVIGNNSATDIVEAEYWLDTDPGAGGGTALTITQGANPVAIASLPFESAPIGLHSLGIRFKDDREIWSSSEVRLFYVVNPIYMAAGHIITGAEYFINYDPGEGYGAPIALPTDGNWDSAFETITDSVSNIPGGKHWLGVRFLDDRGIWSNVLIDSFTVTPILTITVNSSHLPVLYWESADNATEFQIFRATNLSGPFTQIAVTTDSTFTDNENPAAGEKRYYQITETVAPGMAGFRLPNRSVRSTSKRATN
ncbi:hypothetical protein IT157_07270, partial [bacterium]|nr:hypothetical protein [bacterium]